LHALIELPLSIILTMMPIDALVGGHSVTQSVTQSVTHSVTQSVSQSISRFVNY